MTRPEVAVVVLAWNSEATIAECLESILSLDYEPAKVIVVDNGSTDSTSAILSTIHGINVVTLESNTGFAGGHVRALRETTAEYVALVNSDAIVDRRWLGELISVASGTDRFGAAGGRAYEWDGTTRSHSRFKSYHEIDPFDGTTVLRESDLGVVEFVDSLSGAAVLIGRAAIDQIGYFDPIFFAYYEETDLFARMRRTGYEIVYVPDARVWHKTHPSLGFESFRYNYLMFRNRWIFGIRNFDRAFVRTFARRYLREWARSVAGTLVRPTPARIGRVVALAGCATALPATAAARRQITSECTFNTKLSRFEGPRVSVVVTNYNYGRFVSEAIDSVLAQTVAPHEIMVIDDGSTDDSREVLEQYRGVDKIRLVFQLNQGIITARNRGLSETSGEWLVFLDADDTLDPRYIEETFVAVIPSAREPIGFVYSDARMFGARERVFFSRRFSRRWLRLQNFVNSSALIRREAIAAVGSYSEDMSIGFEDWDLYLGIVEAGWSGRRVPRPLLNYRRHSDGSRNTYAHSNLQGVYELVIERHPGLYTPFWKRAALAWLRANQSPWFTLARRAKHAGRYLVHGDFRGVADRLRARAH